MKIRKTNIVPVANAESESQRDAILEVFENIRGKRDEIKVQIHHLETMIEQAIKNSNSISTFDAVKLMNEDDDVTTLVKSKARLEAALKLPNYADPEFRRLTVPYINAIAAEQTREAKAVKDRIEDARAKIKALEAEIDGYIDELHNIAGEWARCLMGIGIYDSTLFTPEVYDFNLFAREYSELCAKFN